MQVHGFAALKNVGLNADKRVKMTEANRSPYRAMRTEGVLRSALWNVGMKADNEVKIAQRDCLSYGGCTDTMSTRKPVQMLDGWNRVLNACSQDVQACKCRRRISLPT